MDSTSLRAALCCREGVDRLPDAVYEYIIRHRFYGAKPQFCWLRQKSYAYLKPYRVPHVAGCEEEAVRLAKFWGEDVEAAAEAAILHDITKKQGHSEQLRLCEKYGIIPDAVEAREPKLLHSRTGAGLARELFGISQPVFDAIEWHTTGREDMSRLEKIIYMADYIEPTRDFDGVEELRRLAYLDLDQAMILGLEMSLNELSQRGAELHPRSVSTLTWLRSMRNNRL
jgi:nicotinate-nucleotide adenylyltransferase